jgi:glycolate oxidase iron-sulfur subunit
MRTNIQSPLAETAAGAIAEAVLRACVHCGMCNAVCPTYQITGDELDGPRGRIYLIKRALEGDAVGPVTQAHLDRCLSCRACETACPSGVEYHRLYDVGRQVVAQRVRRSGPERLVRAAIRAVFAHQARLAPLIAVARGLRWALPKALARRIPPRHAIGVAPAREHATQMILLAGCVQAAAAPHFNAAAARVFDKLGVTLREAPAAGCCGALSAHLDAPDEARAFARANIDAWTPALDAGAQAIVVAASGCAAFIRDYPDLLADDAAYVAKARRVAEQVRDPIEIVGAARLVAIHAPSQPRIAVHEPCTLQNGPGVSGRIATLLTALGYQPQPVADAHLCCGSAGAYSLLQPDFARRLRADKLAALNAGEPQAIYTANIGCWLHLGETSPTPVRHWIEAVDEVLGQRTRSDRP